MKGLKYNLLKFFAEFILIVIGIMLSFYIQGKIDDRESKKEARHILQQILSDLTSDTMQYHHEIHLARYSIDCTNYLLNMDYETQLDTEVELDSAISCIGESKSKLRTPIHAAGYTRLLHFDNKQVINNDSLVNSIFDYYTIDKALMDGQMKLDADFVEGPMTEVYMESDNYDVVNAVYQRFMINKNYPDKLKDAIIHFLENKKIRSSMIFNMNNKMNYRDNMHKTIESATEKIELLKKWLAKS